MLWPSISATRLLFPVSYDKYCLLTEFIAVGGVRIGECETIVNITFCWSLYFPVPNFSSSVPKEINKVLSYLSYLVLFS